VTECDEALSVIVVRLRTQSSSSRGILGKLKVLLTFLVAGLSTQVDGVSVSGVSGET